MKVDLKKWYSRESLVMIGKYVLSSVVMYFGVSVALYVGIGLFHLNSLYWYLVVYFFAYLIDYVVNLRLIFYAQHSRAIAIKYSLHIAFFYALNGVLFDLILKNRVHYLIATWTVVVILFPLRFLSYKKFVYRRNSNGPY